MVRDGSCSQLRSSQFESVIAATLLVDFEALLVHCLGSADPSPMRDPPVSTKEAIALIKAVLSVLLTPGLNEDVDRICRDKLGIPLSELPVGRTR